MPQPQRGIAARLAVLSQASRANQEGDAVGSWEPFRCRALVGMEPPAVNPPATDVERPPPALPPATDAETPPPAPETPLKERLRKLACRIGDGVPYGTHGTTGMYVSGGCQMGNPSDQREASECGCSCAPTERRGRRGRLCTHALNNRKPIEPATTTLAPTAAEAAGAGAA